MDEFDTLEANGKSLDRLHHRKQLLQCQKRLFHCELELKALGALFYGLEGAELAGEALQGTGITLKRISGSLSKVSEVLQVVLAKYS